MDREPTEAELREDTMIYRAPTADSDETSISEIWGQRVETRVVPAAEVPELLASGWYSHPKEIDGSERVEPTSKGDESPDPGSVAGHKDALEAAEKLVDELTKERDAARQLVAENGKLADDRQAEIVRQDEAIKNLTAKLLTVEGERDKALSDLKAAEALTAEESKAKDAALAELAALKEQQSAAKVPSKPKGS